MRRIVTAVASTITGLVLLFSWPTSTNQAEAAAEPETDSTTDSTSESTTDSTSESTTTDDETAEATEEPTEATTATYTGGAASTRYGDVVVEITVTDGELTDVQAVDYPYSDRKDQEINDYAIPILNAEALEQGDAGIAMVSGATVTSTGYVASLQDALDQAGL